MNEKPTTIARSSALPLTQDFYHLRRQGVGFIEQMGSRLWTDYNTHDPGITILEALCYALTDLSYRVGWDIKDLLALEKPSADLADAFPGQAFFSAREILTVNPTTPDDFRRLLIDLDKVRNAWVAGKECPCETSYYACCEEDQLRLSYHRPSDAERSAKQVTPLGLYEARLELEADVELGDLNDLKIEQDVVIAAADGVHQISMELRFPRMGLADGRLWDLFLGSKQAEPEDRSGVIAAVTLLRLGATKTFDVFSAASLPDEQARDAYLRAHWRDVLFVDLAIEFTVTLSDQSTLSQELYIDNAALRVFGGDAARGATSIQLVTSWLEDASAGGFVARYRHKARAARRAVNSAKAVLHAHRNLGEDFCRVEPIGIEEVAVCAEVEVLTDADIESVQARIWFEIEQYFNPAIRFNSLPALLAAGERVEEIFNGPQLDNGFIQAQDLDASALKTALRTSDIINRLMDIEGVMAVNRLLLTKYDAEGNVVPGAADPLWDAVDGKPIFDANKVSAAWLLFVSQQRQPRLYRKLSRFLFYKNGLPFVPRMDEAEDSLQQLHGAAERPKNPFAAKDLDIPQGSFKQADEYYPLQCSFPQAYGIGAEGLPAHVSPERRAQARQLKAYLMVFEQLLGNALAQLAHTADLFSLDPELRRTYFVKEFSEALIPGFDELTAGLDKAAVEAISESDAEFRQRRNRFLDHLLARFGEQFSEYALLLGRLDGRQLALERLIKDKIAFLKAYPQISHDRGKAFNYRLDPCSPANYPGIKKRISLLLGYPDLEFVSTVEHVGADYRVEFALRDRSMGIWLEGGLTLTAADEAAAKALAYEVLTQRLSRADACTIDEEEDGFRLILNDLADAELGRHPDLFAARSLAQALCDELLAWAANERCIVVEHLLLRPKFPGDALYPACADGACRTCGDEDPYSFRITFVMPGWTTAYKDNMDLRRFAERSIQQETPAHLLGKTCWVGNDGFVENPCAEVVDQLAALLIATSAPSEGVEAGDSEACACALEIYHEFSRAFVAWYENRAHDHFQSAALGARLQAEFASQVRLADSDCAALMEDPLWSEVEALMVAHFRQVVLHGLQFERFEGAWRRWLQANARFDWAEERLHERVAAILRARLLDASASADALHGCAVAILRQYGSAFYDWMADNLAQGREVDEFTAFAPGAVSLGAELGFTPGTAVAIGEMLKERYAGYREVSYRLWVVGQLLGNLRNIYPGATLHDCDDGSDRNPVRLDNTALGNYPLRGSLS
ncbi:MAG: hypothetical protein DVS81_11095 [Candidatus Accumulibacter meliphilus]|uniref:Uncharacterized protein n=1 Tax=Candidatus Accumulibacter meliphilus TaxID=2211374 RepID=A0A369XM36_9PROT|nr:MAG: hypothetical protein DVS81_11095 [Candidatus Accumulibacter meliphilus]